MSMSTGRHPVQKIVTAAAAVGIFLAVSMGAARAETTYRERAQEKASLSLATAGTTADGISDSVTLGF